MYFTQDSLLAENEEPLIITAAPFGPQWNPSDYPEDIAVSWDAQVQKAVDCYNTGATLLHDLSGADRAGRADREIART